MVEINEQGEVKVNSVVDDVKSDVLKDKLKHSQIKTLYYATCVRMRMHFCM